MAKKARKKSVAKARKRSVRATKRKAMAKRKTKSAARKKKIRRGKRKGVIAEIAGAYTAVADAFTEAERLHHKLDPGVSREPE